MGVDIRLLQYFAAVADEGNLTRAAQRLFVSQPALTKQIRQLEAQLGVTLFTRSRAGMALTDAGCVLAEHTQDIIATFARRRPGWRVDMRQTEWSDPTAGLADGLVDAALLRLPFPGQNGFRVEILLTEPRWAALPATHRLAEHTEIAFDDLRDKPFVATPPDSGRWRDYWLATDERNDHPVRMVNLSGDQHQMDAFVWSNYPLAPIPARLA